MNEIDFVKNQGWILSESGLKTIDLNGTAKKNIIKVLLDRDLREIGAGVADLHKGKFENIENELIVLQILKLRNISAPKANESSKTAPKLLKLQLTDGQNTYSAIEMEPTALSLETPPGSKICLKVKQLKYANGQLLLTPKNMEILGGYVESLVSKWEISKSLATTMKGSRSGAAPPFIPFGQKIQQNIPTEKGFKSLQQNKQKEGEENSEFNAQRQDAIAEATKQGTRKTFGGGNKTLVDSNVQKIMDKGYTEEQATVALKYAKNNVEKALSNLKRRDERQQRASSHDYDTRENTRDYNSKRGKGGSSHSENLPSAKPSTGVSLFDFLENKIPESSTTNNNTNHTAKSYAQNSTTSSSHHSNNKYDNNSSSHHNNERFENNISSSFRKYDKENSNKSHQQWSQYSSSNEQSKSSQNYHQQKNSYNSRNDYRSSSHHEGGSKEHYNRREDYSSRKYEKDSRDHRDGGQRESKYHSSSNYSSKPNHSSSSNANNNNNNSSSYSSQHKSASQKPSVASNGATSQSTYNSHSSQASGGKYEGKGKYEKYGDKPEYNRNNSSGGKMTSKDYNNYSSSSGANNNNSNYNSKYDKPPRSNHVSHSSHSNDMYQQKPQQRGNIVDSMEKMSLKSNQHQSYKPYESSYESKSSSSYPPLTPSNETKPNFPKQQQQSNYPPNIVGFQNKEANEQAKNALKTKNIPGNVATKQPNWQQQQQQPPQQVPIAVPIPQSAPTMKAGPLPPFSSTSPAQPPPAMHPIQPQPSFVQHPVMHAIPQPVLTTANPQVFHAAPIPYQGQIIMQSVQPAPIQQVGPQPLKVGDLCLAKYWEDGKFYNAKITGISESTFVVLFTDYGNAEEVRKNDCVPLISVPTCPTPPMANFVQTQQMGSYRSISTPQQQKMPPQQHGYQQGGMPYKGAGKNPRRN